MPKITIDETSIDKTEYDKQYQMAMQVDDHARNFGIVIIDDNISKTKKQLEDAITNRPGAKKLINDLQANLTKFISQRKAFEDAVYQISKNNAPSRYPTVTDISEPLGRRGYKVHVTSSGSVEVYKKGSRIALKNLQVAYDPRTGYIDYGPNQHLQKLIGSIFEPKKAD